MALNSYSYQACDVNGAIHSGQINAENEQEVVMLLQKRQLIPVKVELAPASGQGFSFGSQQVKNRDIIDFTEGLCTLVEARIPLDKALGLLENLTEKAVVKQLIAELRQSVKEGKSLADALQSHPRYFTRMYINMVRAGEEGGILEHLLPKLADFMSNADQARRTVIGSLTYPAILGIVGISSVALLLIYVVPQFAIMFENLGTAIPPSAALLMNLSTWLKTYGWTLLALPFLVIYGWRYLDSTAETRLQRDQFLLSIPILGTLLLEAESSRFCRTLGALLSAGIPLLKGLNIARGVMENQVLALSLSNAEEAVRGGVSLGRALAKEDKFPLLLNQLVIVGEETGRTASILEKLADTFEQNVKQRTARLVSLLEPMMILIMGVVVGTVVVIMLSAVFSINQVKY